MTAPAQPAPRVTAVLGLWLDRPPLEVLDTAVAADELGYPELWIGEMATFDAFSLATAVAGRTSTIELTVGPLAAAVRTPVTMATGAATVAAVTGRPVGVAVGSSSRAVVELWHGRSADHPAAVLEESAGALRALLSGARTTSDGDHVRTFGYRLRTGALPRDLTVAAFGARAVGVAAAIADRMVVNLVTVEEVAAFRSRLDAAAALIGRPAPRLAVWAAAAVEPSPAARAQLARSIVPYLAARGYDDMFRRAGFGELVDVASRGARPAELLPLVPDELVASVGIVGPAAEAQARIAAYLSAGADEVALVPSATDDDPAGRGTLAALAPASPAASTADAVIHS